MLTIDILFESREKYEYVKKTGILTRETVARLYGLPVEAVQYYDFEKANSMKFSFDRGCGSGDFEDRDIYGCQKHAPLVNLEIPDENILCCSK